MDKFGLGGEPAPQFARDFTIGVSNDYAMVRVTINGQSYLLQTDGAFELGQGLTSAYVHCLTMKGIAEQQQRT